MHVDDLPASLDAFYQPTVELTGDIAASLTALTAQTAGRTLDAAMHDVVAKERAKLDEAPVAAASTEVVHPTEIVATLRDLLPDETVVACDIGSSYVWMARHFHTFEPRRLLFSNGQQTLGVALPWAMAASLLRPGAQSRVDLGRRRLRVLGDGTRDGGPPALEPRAPRLG